MHTFHPLIRQWFQQRFGAPTPAQVQGWPRIRAGEDTLIAAPTGSGKTLAAFLVCIDRLLRDALEGRLCEGTRVVYVSPLKALSNDVRRNLEGPLAELKALAEATGQAMPEIRALVRTGDTPASARQAMLRRPPHILVTTPESLYLLLTSPKSRLMLEGADTVIVDEIHALARSRRGSHLALTLERLDALAARRPVRIGLSATQRPIEAVGRFLVGAPERPCSIVDTGHQRDLDLGLEVPPSELSAAASNEQWDEVNARITELIGQHRSTLIFVNTRKLAERVAFQLEQHLGEDAVASHHGSLSKERRLDAEERLKSGQLKAIVATASLELGIDIGWIDLVCQIGSPRCIATFLQRVGRSGHAIRATPKGRLFPLTRDELLECMALLRAARAGELDRIEIPEAPLDVLAQQLVAAVACEEELGEDELFELVRRAQPYHRLSRQDFDAVVSMLSHGAAPSMKAGAYLHHDAVGKRLRPRRAARITALQNAGAIPEKAEYRVVDLADGSLVGTVDEDFAIERPAGTVFLLGTTSWQIVHTRGLVVSVVDAHGAPPTIPFWFGEAPGRTSELSGAVSELRRQLAARIDLDADVGAKPEESLSQAEGAAALRGTDPPALRAARRWLADEVAEAEWAGLQAAHYVAVGAAALGLVPTQEEVVFERFFDDTGGMQLVIHAPFGMRVNRALGLGLRKRFCRSFDFELQAVATDDGILLSLGPAQSFPIDELFGMLTAENLRGLLEQALLQVPFFQVRWRWNANRSLTVLRFERGKKVPPALQRFRSDDLLTAVFPAVTECFEHRTGDVEFPDHPLVQQTLRDCLEEVCDLEGAQAVLRRVAAGEIRYLPRESREPSPFSYGLLNAAPYAFLDDAPLEERRARALAQRRTLPLEAFRDLATLDPEVIHRVSSQAWPQPRDPDELHEALGDLVLVDEAEAGGWAAWFEALVAAGRASVASLHGRRFWVATERVPVVMAAHPEAALDPPVQVPEALRVTWDPVEARGALLRGQLECRGVVSEARLADTTGIPLDDLGSLLPALEARGDVIRGEFTGAGAREWCTRRLLTRIHRQTLEALRRAVEPVTPEQLLRFLTRHHGLVGKTRRHGRDGLRATLLQLAGFETPAGEWERELLPSRIEGYRVSWLDELCHTGEFAWGRLSPPRRDPDAAPARGGMTRVVPVAFVPREDLEWVVPARDPEAEASLSGAAKAVLEALDARGAQFADELLTRTRLLRYQLDEALGELARLGLATADGFAGVRPLVDPAAKKHAASRERSRRRRPGRGTYGRGGRWVRFAGSFEAPSEEQVAEAWAWQLLDRYGVIFRDLLERESAAPPWWRLARVYRRLEARGEVRGGRFVTGVAGEQFAADDVVEQLRKVRDTEGTLEWVVLGAADPLNLVGILTGDSKLPPTRCARLALRDGRLAATFADGAVHFHQSLPPTLAREIEAAMKTPAAYRQPEPPVEDPVAAVVRALAPP